jgi:hypothetical protein
MIHFWIEFKTLMVVCYENHGGREDGIRWVLVSSHQPLPEEDRVNHKLFFVNWNLFRINSLLH